MAVGSFLRQLMAAFDNASEEAIIGTAVNSIGTFVDQSGMKTPEKIFQAMIIAAKVGVSTKTGSLNEKEKQLSDEVFGNIWNGDMEQIYDMLSQEANEGEYQFLQLVGSTPIGIELLKFILAFAYIDGEMDEAIAERLEGCFGAALLADFFNHNDEENGMDSLATEPGFDLSLLTSKERAVYDCIEKHDDGRGVPAQSYFYLYFGDQIENGLECTIDKTEFGNIVEELYKKGLLEKYTSFSGNDIYSLKKA